MMAALILRPSDDIGSILQEFVNNHNVTPFIKELQVLETEDKPFNAFFPKQCQQAVEQSHGSFSGTVVALTASCTSDSGIRSLWYMVQLLASGLTEIRLDIGGNVPFALLRSFFVFLGERIRSQHRFSRVGLFHVNVKLDRLDAGERLNLCVAVLDAIKASHHLRSLALPLDLLAIAWDASFDAIFKLHTLTEIIFHPGVLHTPSPSSRSTVTSQQKLQQLEKLSIAAPLSFCADIVQTLSALFSTLRLECDELRGAADMEDAILRINNACLPTHSTPPLSPLLELYSPTPFSMFSVRGLHMPSLASSITHLNLLINKSGFEPVDLRALLPLSGMETFTLSHPYPIFYDSQMISDLLTCWTRIRELSLNPRPSQGLGFGVLPSLMILEDVARCGPSLHEFHALLDGYSFELPASAIRHSWQTLQVLDLGFSVGPTDEEHTRIVLDYLASLFPMDNLTLVTQSCNEWAVALAKASRRRAWSSSYESLG
ncbi:hypothetical protein BDW22DRAFT_464375 [Trametopsis cervina]|nr:hypothetical protein BDW22DRAFT_464375 [Trametopsis cervina]